MAYGWYHAFHRLCVALYFDRVRWRHLERVPASGPVLFLGLHRNGAVDGFIYHRHLGGTEFLIACQLRRAWLGRLFFTGIEVVRAGDEGDASGNAAALERCRTRLEAGGRLFIFPEGTSGLGPRHLPFKSGAAQLVLECLERGVPLQVIPLGIHYERAWAFRSRVEVVVGMPISVDLSPTVTGWGRLKELKRRIQAGLESVGANFRDAAAQERAEALARAAAQAPVRWYFDALKAFERTVPAPVEKAWSVLEPEFRSQKPWYADGFCLRPPAPFDLGRLLLGVPIVAIAALLNAPPLLAGALAARKLADDRNVVSLWRILVGVPAWGLWVLMAAVLAWVTGSPAGLGIYALMTWVGLRLYRPVKQSGAAWLYHRRHPELREEIKHLQQLLPSRA